ncbi:MAG: citryl-CoA lyase [Candidatus Aminicenantes bacterium 4484_214]|nr:MAG: citryl-CoA lyase [Candidatus Aminicenantes bacterium 4484_214]
MGELHWKTSISQVEPNKILVRGYPIDGLMGQISFGQAVYLLFQGKLPPPEVGQLIETILVSSIDHGPTPPSVLAARTVASTGAELNAAVAAGVLAISRYHGGAIEEGMRQLKMIVDLSEERGISLEEATREILQQLKAEGKRFSGFGHRFHTQDPRTTKLFSLAEELGITGKYVETALVVERILSEMTGKKLPINVDGAIAALLAELEIPPEIGNAFFMIARLPGLVAHIYEEKTRMRPMRKIDPQDFEYDGPSERE